MMLLALVVVVVGLGGEGVRDGGDSGVWWLVVEVMVEMGRWSW